MTTAFHFLFFGSSIEIPQASSETAAAATQGDIVLLIVYVLLALVFSFLCSVAEAVLLSVTPSYIAGLKKRKPGLAARLSKLKLENVDRSLAAILTLNTIAHTVGAIGSGAKATIVFGSAFFGIFSALMTLMILFLSEIIPKTLGATYWRQLASSTAFFVQGLILSLYPLIWVSEKLTRLIGKGHHAGQFDREEFVAMASMGEEQGHLDDRESSVIHNLFKLKGIRARDIMTPRTVMVALQRDLTVQQALEKADQSIFSRIPLYGTNLDDINTFILRDDLLLAKAEGREEQTLKELARSIQAIQADTSLSNVFDILLESRNKMVLVVEEYGGTLGLVTTEDVVETLLGMEIIDETDRVEDMQALARKKWMERAEKLGVDIGSLKDEHKTG
ncbi:MAG: hemolysin [Acidobacteria bacterium]|nr:MAG: hemolysin [Acidobacteriota bacterium]